jgi:hypothetical protein
MTPRQTRPHFHSASLLRVLADLADVPALASGTDFAEKLGLWVSFTDAIHLCAVHNAAPAVASAAASSRAPARLAEEVDRLQAGMEQAIRQTDTNKASKNRVALPVPLLELPLDAKSAYEPYRRYYQAQQREMEVNLAAMRARVRGALARASAPLQQLAALDEALESILNEREAKLLGSLPNLLEKRFKHLLKAHQKAVADRQQADDPLQWLAPGSWLARFVHELKTVLLAELETRLQPTRGLLEALQNESLTTP